MHGTLHASHGIATLLHGSGRKREKEKVGRRLEKSIDRTGRKSMTNDVTYLM